MKSRKARKIKPTTADSHLHCTKMTISLLNQQLPRRENRRQIHFFFLPFQLLTRRKECKFHLSLSKHKPRLFVLFCRKTFSFWSSLSPLYLTSTAERCLRTCRFQRGFDIVTLYHSAHVYPYSFGPGILSASHVISLHHPVLVHRVFFVTSYPGENPLKPKKRSAIEANGWSLFN